MPHEGDPYIAPVTYMTTAATTTMPTTGGTLTVQGPVNIYGNRFVSPDPVIRVEEPKDEDPVAWLRRRVREVEWR